MDARRNRDVTPQTAVVSSEWFSRVVVCNPTTRLHCCISYVGEQQFVVRCYFSFLAGRQQQHHKHIKVKQQR